MTPTVVALVLEAWRDLDRVLEGLDAATATEQVGGQSAFGWTLAHVTNQVDSWINVNFQGRPPHPLISAPEFRAGSAGAALDWDAIRAAVDEVRRTARPYLEGLTEHDLERIVPYTGALLPLREHGLRLRYALVRIAAHHYFHIGVAACQRDRLGHSVGDYPGLLAGCL